MTSDRAVVCSHVADGGAPILYAARGRETGAEWRFRCGRAPHDAERDRDARSTRWSRATPRRSRSCSTHVELRSAAPALARGGTSRRGRSPSRPARRAGGRRSSRATRRAAASRSTRSTCACSPRSPRPGGTSFTWTAAGQGHAFTIGLFRSFDHPEVFCSGSAPRPARPRSTASARACAAGSGSRTAGWPRGSSRTAPVTFRTVARRHYPAYLGYGGWFHGGPRFPALQVVWPDAEGRFPWERWSRTRCGTRSRSSGSASRPDGRSGLPSRRRAHAAIAASLLPHIHGYARSSRLACLVSLAWLGPGILNTRGARCRACARSRGGSHAAQPRGELRRNATAPRVPQEAARAGRGSRR